MTLVPLAAFVISFTFPPPPDDRPAAKVLEEVRGIVLPEPPEEAFPHAVRAYRQERQRLETRKADLIRELFLAHPDCPELTELMPLRWAIVTKLGAMKAAEALSEVELVLAAERPEALKVEAAHFQAEAACLKLHTRAEIDKAIIAINAFAKRAPSDERAADLLQTVAKATTDLALKVELRDRLARDYPDSAAALKEIADRRVTEAIGQPFVLEFDDAISGKHVSMSDLKGKVVVVDFWATWCGPCVAEMPKMKQLYAEYQDENVEFIGVSLDQPEAEGGLSALKSFVTKNQITWPQFFQGNGWESKFSSSWGVKGIPTVFIIDTEGKLHATDARGRLEALIPLLIEKGKLKAAPDRQRP